MSQATVSVIVAVKNASRFLAQALDSLVAQTSEDFEVIIVDGGSTDDSLAIARAYPKVTCLDQQGRGFANAWNTGIARSSAPFIAFLDSDDLWLPDKLALQLAVFESRPATECVFGRVSFFLEPGCALPRGFRPGVLEGSHLTPFCGSLLARRSALDKVGPFDERLRIASDILWMARLRAGCDVEPVDQLVLRKRLHDGNLGHTTAWPIFKSELLAVMKQRVDAARDTPRPDRPDER